MAVQPSTRMTCALIAAAATSVAAGCGADVAGQLLPAARPSGSGVDVEAGAGEGVGSVVLPPAARADSTELETSPRAARLYRLRLATYLVGNLPTPPDHKPSANGERPLEPQAERAPQDQDLDPRSANLEEAPHGG